MRRKPREERKKKPREERKEKMLKPFLKQLKIVRYEYHHFFTCS
jgi:hypothetical protein